MKKALPPNLKRLSAAKQRRLDSLLDKNSEGTIAPPEKAELEGLVAEAERLMVANAKRLADFADDDRAAAPRAAVPVTVWVKPEIRDGMNRLSWVGTCTLFSTANPDWSFREPTQAKSRSQRSG